MYFDNVNQNHSLEIHDFCHFLTNSMTIPGLENKNHFPWLFQAVGTLTSKKCKDLHIYEYYAAEVIFSQMPVENCIFINT